MSKINLTRNKNRSLSIRNPTRNRKVSMNKKRNKGEKWRGKEIMKERERGSEKRAMLVAWV